MKEKTPSDKPLQGRMVMVVGVNPSARVVAQLIQARGGAVIIASRDRDAARELAQALECRHVLYEAMYSTMHAVLVVCDVEKDPNPKAPAGAGGIHPGYLKAGMTVLDLTAALKKSTLVREAEVRGCRVVLPRQVLLDQLALQSRMLTSKEVPREVLA